MHPSTHIHPVFLLYLIYILLVNELINVYFFCWLCASQRAESVFDCTHHSILCTGPLKELNKYVHKGEKLFLGKKIIFAYFVTHTESLSLSFKQKELYYIIH